MDVSYKLRGRSRCFVQQETNLRNLFRGIDLMTLRFQLDIFIEDMQRHDRFEDFHDLGVFSMRLVEIKKHVTYPIIY
ncbi:hypothetical protein ACS0TY_014982 [Phlomoides rotata]